MEAYDPGAASAVASLPITLLYLAIAVASIVGMWKVFEKAGEPGWAAIVPFYNMYVLAKIATGNGLLFLLVLIPIVGAAYLFYKLGLAFGKSMGFIVGLILLSPVFLILLGFSEDKYQGVQA